MPPNWRLQHEQSVVVPASSARVWVALTDPEATPLVYLGAALTLGSEGEPFTLQRADGWHVTGTVVVRRAPTHLRLTWNVPAPVGEPLPAREIEVCLTTLEDADGPTRVTVREHVDGALPPPYDRAAETGWAMILRRLQQVVCR